MRPTLAAEQVQGSLSEYLSTTYSLADEGTRRALEEFLTDPADGIFRGPYLRARTPFQFATPQWQQQLTWWPREFDDTRTPYAHQSRAWERLSSLHSPGEPTLVTTGTGSGKTESFLVPILDHCRRASQAGVAGVKALLLYPMNALATDQAHRLNDQLAEDSRLSEVTAGLYIGDTPSKDVRARAPKIMMRREQIRQSPPDILITNYKMLDLLVQRREDQPLLQDMPLAYLVLDEFHTYDGAQGTDVAMLLRRLGSAAGLASEGRPLGAVCPIATSATLGAGGTTPTDSTAMTSVAEQVFGVPFPPESVIGEDRQSVSEALGESNLHLPFPEPQDVIACGDPLRDESALEALAVRFTGKRGLTPARLGAKLRQHRMTNAVLEILGDDPRTLAEIAEVLPHRAPHWGAALLTAPRQVAQALARYVALLSVARDPEAPERPLLSIEVHHWVRPVAQLLRGVTSARAQFRWDDERVGANGQPKALSSPPPGSPAPTDAPESGHVLEEEQHGEAPAPAEDSAPAPAQTFLPAVYCRECGRSGWAALADDTDTSALELAPAKTRRSSLTKEQRRVRNMLSATNAEVRAAARGDASSRGNASVLVLDAVAGRLRPLDPQHDVDHHGDPTPKLSDAAFVRAVVSPLREAQAAAESDTCPVCDAGGAIRYLGTGVAALASAAVTQLFTGGELDRTQGERKTLLFNDALQDAAHRAGYLANRSYTFSFRSLLTRGLEEETPLALNELVAEIMSEVADSPAVQAAVVPPDLHTVRGVNTLLSKRSRGSQATWELIAERLAFSAVLEFGLSSRLGRTLEMTRAAAVEVPLADPERVAEIVDELLRATPGKITLPDEDGLPTAARYLAFVRGLLERLRLRGGIRHRWLDRWVQQGGNNRFPIWTGRPLGMPAFPRGRAAPRFLATSARGRSEFDNVGGRGGWYQDWATRCLGIDPQAAGRFLSRLLPELARAGVLGTVTTPDGPLVYGLQPGHLAVRRIADEEVNEAVARCTSCAWQQTVHPELADHWHGQPCLRYRCRGKLVTGGSAAAAEASGPRQRDFRNDYYRRMYRVAGAYTINAAEHTGTLTRSQREAVEQAFRDGVDAHYANPQVLSCTPTLELGIDIGDLSTVVLASLPNRPANYVQRTGRAGRRTGNSYLLTLVENRPRDRYFLEEPRQMIAGEVRPPGCFLSAVEILRRQYLAHLLDRAAAGRLPHAGGGDDAEPLEQLPQRASKLFGRPSWDAGSAGDQSWAKDFADAAVANGAMYVTEFLALYPHYDPATEQGVTQEARRELTEYATGGIVDALREAHEAWTARRRELRRRSGEIEAAIAATPEADPESQQHVRELRAERRSIERVQGAHGGATAQQTLVDLGLLPNYGLMEARTELEALLTWREVGAEGPTFHTELLTYERSARLALRDFAPGNFFYVQGYKHHISGLDVGTPQRPAWAWWRICPSCPYVRTTEAEADTSPCPRCSSRAIADNGCLHRVLDPRRVHSRDKREDARVRDDRDEREQQSYSLVTAIDMPRSEIASAWRHEKAVFGWEFTRKATVRRINTGLSRDGKGESFTGTTAHLNGFWTCPSCGYSDPSGGPDAHALRSRYHRPWCALLRRDPVSEDPRTDGMRLLLGHELTTEALRILIPAVTAYQDERKITLKSLLLAGISSRYGGDPDHLDVTFNAVPDEDEQDGQTRRHYLTLYDVLPGGTGYLHRLAGREGLREVLAAARTIVEECPCRGEDRQACHRCLLRHVNDKEYDYVSRDVAMDLLGELLGIDGSGWQVRPTGSAAEITLAGQLESELDRRFFDGLLAWAERADTEASARSAPAQEGRRRAELRLTAPDGSVTSWQVSTQEDLGFTRPDVVFRRVDAAPLRVAVYLDGYRYHAAPSCNRTADDAHKRAQLRAEGWQVFQLTWDDVEEWTAPAGKAGTTSAVWEPYGVKSQRTACKWHEESGYGPQEMGRLVWVNPVWTLLSYLASPDAAAWQQRVTSALAGALAVPGAVHGAADDAEVAEQIATALRGAPLPEVTSAARVFLVHVADDNGCPLVIVVDRRTENPDGVWSALTVLDDSPEAAADAVAHRRRWRAWLYWTNLLQFLNEGDGDGVQLTASQLGDFDLAPLAVTGGQGWLTSRREQRVPERAAAVAAEEAVADPERRREWDEVLQLVLDDEPGLPELARLLADRGAPVPVQSYELDSNLWPAELAWPSHRVAIVAARQPGDYDAQDRDQAYQAAGWTVRSAPEWEAKELVALLNTPKQP